MPPNSPFSPFDLLLADFNGMEFDGKVPIVTCSSKGIGRGIERILVCGSAAVQCGKASPFRPSYFKMAALPLMQAEIDALYLTRQSLLLPYLSCEGSIACFPDSFD
jgi:hypothetical protein